MVSDSQTVQFWPHSVIHNWKAVHLTILKLWWKVIFWPPLKRQNFRDTSGLNCYPHPISCRIPPKLFHWSELMCTQFVDNLIRDFLPATSKYFSAPPSPFLTFAYFPFPRSFYSTASTLPKNLTIPLINTHRFRPILPTLRVCSLFDFSIWNIKSFEMGIRLSSCGFGLLDELYYLVPRPNHLAIW